MATRALIGYLSEDREFTCTYNHYDGYPEYLGKILKEHYNSEPTAKEVASTGYISNIEEDGTINSKYNEPPNEMILDDDIVEAGLQIGEKVDEYGGQYGYVWFIDEWITLKNNGIRSMADQFDFKLPADGAGIFRVEENLNEKEKEDMAESYKAKWNEFITENKVIDDQWTVYVKSLVNSIRLNGVDDYVNFSEDDFKEDFDNYIADKMDL
tara:strand:+ start:1770 stop:2402 length:633 start_codon:yes stop_codon:yes gene_type:complete